MRREEAWKRWGGALAALALLTHCGGDASKEPASGPPPSESASDSTSGPAPGDAASGVTQPVSATYTFSPSADARVEEASPTRNFGSESNVGADLSPHMESYLRFPVSGLPGRVTRAVLRLYAYDGSSDGPQVYLTAGGWTEGGITWNNRPARFGLVADVGAIPNGAWVEYDVTAVTGNGELNLALIPTSGNGTDFYSRESSRTALRPQLVVTVEEAPGPDCMPMRDLFDVRTVPVSAYVSQGEPGRNFSTSPALFVDGSPRLESYFKFTPFTSSGLTLSSIRLNLYAFDGTVDGPRLYRTGTGWSSDTLTWNTRPALLGGPIANLGAIGANTWVSYDLTGMVPSAGEVGVGLIPESGDGVGFYSGEANNSLRPFVTMNLESPPFCTYHGTGGGRTLAERQVGGPGPEGISDLASDASGYVAAGRFGDASFSEFSMEGFALARYDAEGVHQWTRVLATEGMQARAITLTPLGNILVVGNYRGSPDLGAGRLPEVPSEFTMPGFFIAKFSPTGRTEWSRGFQARDAAGQLRTVTPAAVATDAAGSLIVTGTFAGGMDLGGGRLDARSKTQPDGNLSTGGFLAKFSFEGRHLWSKAFGTDAALVSIEGRSVATDAEGNVLVGTRAGTHFFDRPHGEAPPVLAKYSPSGSLLWERAFTGAYGEIADVKPQGADRVAFLANLGGTFTFAGASHTGGNPADPSMLPENTSGFLGALTRSGADVWTRSVGSPYSLWFRQLVVAADGSLVATGVGDEEFDVGGGPLGFNLFDILLFNRRHFVARYSPEGGHLWSRTFSAEYRDVRMAPRPGDGVLLGGAFFAQLKVDDRILTSRGFTDLLYLQLSL